MNMQVHYSNKTNEWETPQDLYDKYNRIFQFTLDPCANERNAKCDKYYTKDDNGLIQDWSNERVFMNPPYGREIAKWIKKAYEESLKGTLVVCLIPARTDTSYWHNYIFGKAEIKFLKGRVKFQNRLLPSWREDGSHKISGAPFPSAVVIFGL